MTYQTRNSRSRLRYGRPPVAVRPPAVPTVNDDRSRWTVDAGIYVHRTKHVPYVPHHDNERAFVVNDEPRRMLAKGGEGGGKSVAAIIKTLERVRRGMVGIMGSPDMPHFARSLWREFSEWCPWQHVTKRHAYRAAPDWIPTQSFTLAFDTGGMLLCGGFDEPLAWEGPNVHFACYDEPRRQKTATMLKVLDGRIRLVGPHDEPPQLFLASTPRMHWLYDYFGPVQPNDPLADWKRESLVIDLLTAGNAANLAPGYIEQRRQGLTELEARVLLEAAWVDVDDVDRFLPSILLWDACTDPALPVLDAYTPCVMAIDAGESNDTFAVVLVSADPSNAERLAVRYARAYVPTGGRALDFDSIESDIRELCERYAITESWYDRFLMGQMIRRLTHPDSALPVPFLPFDQGGDRLVADKLLRDTIMQRRVVHNGMFADLRDHLDNADRRASHDDRALRIVKRTYSQKIDLAVCLSMCVYRAGILFLSGASGSAAGGTRPAIGRMVRRPAR